MKYARTVDKAIGGPIIGCGLSGNKKHKQINHGIDQYKRPVQSQRQDRVYWEAIGFRMVLTRGIYHG